MRQVVILSGVSGAGKSTYAEKLLTETQGIKVSADHYFMWEDMYKFDPTKLGEAHADCFRRFISHLQAPFSWSCVVVDNTNTTVEEIAPYILGAQAFDYQAEVRTLWVPARYTAAQLAARCIHGVSAGAIQKQRDRLQKRKLPPFWKSTNIQVEL